MVYIYINKWYNISTTILKGREFVLWIEMPALDNTKMLSTIIGEHAIGVSNFGDFKCSSISGEEMRHWQISKYKKSDVMWDNDLRRKGFEPFYEEKLQILHEIGRWKNVALEVFPTSKELVDRVDVYHMWEFEHADSFLVDTKPIYIYPKRFTRKFKDTHYEAIEHYRNGAVYIYFQSDDKMPWREKQALKDHVVGPDREGVEIITEAMLGVGYGVIIVLPRDRQLSFTLE